CWNSGLVKSKTSSVVGEIACVKRVYGRFRQISFATVRSAIHQHLHQHSKVLCIAKQTCVTSNSAHHSSTLVVHVTGNVLAAESDVFFSWCYLFGFQSFQRKIVYCAQSKWLIEFFFYKSIQS